MPQFEGYEINDPQQPQPSFLDRAGQVADANAFALSRGVMQIGSMPAKAISAGAHAVLPRAVSQYIATPQQIQNSWEDIDKVYQQGTEPGMGVSNVAGNLLAAGGLSGGAAKVATAASGNLIPLVAGATPQFLKAPLQMAGSAGVQGLFTNVPGMREKLVNIPGGLLGVGLGAAGGVLSNAIKYGTQLALASYKTPEIVKSIQPKASKEITDELQILLNKNAIVDTGSVKFDLPTLTKDLQSSQLVNKKAAEVLVNLNKLPRVPSILESLGMQTLGGSVIGGAVGGTAGGIQAAVTGGSIIGGIKKGASYGASVAAGLTLGRMALGTILKSPTLINSINTVEQWANNSSISKYFMNRLANAGLSVALDKDSNISITHEDEQPKTVQFEGYDINI